MFPSNSLSLDQLVRTVCAVRKTETALSEYRRYLDMVSFEEDTGVIRGLKRWVLLSTRVDRWRLLWGGSNHPPNANRALAEKFITILLVFFYDFRLNILKWENSPRLLNTPLYTWQCHTRFLFHELFLSQM